MPDLSMNSNWKSQINLYTWRKVTKRFSRQLPLVWVVGFCAALTPPTHAGGEILTVYKSTAGVYFQIHPQYSGEISNLIRKVRARLEKAKTNGMFTAYLSVPISSGGYFPINCEIASNAAYSISERFGPTNLFVLNPANYCLANIGNTKPGGGDYMAVWSDVLAGADGKGNVFNMVYFVGPADVRSYFGIGSKNELPALENWIAKRESCDTNFDSYISSNRIGFLRYYGFLASCTFSEGSHDEWNIAKKLNEERGKNPPIAINFDGHAVSPAELNTSASTGDEFLPSARH